MSLFGLAKVADVLVSQSEPYGAGGSAFSRFLWVSLGTGQGIRLRMIVHKATPIPNELRRIDGVSRAS